MNAFVTKRLEFIVLLGVTCLGLSAIANETAERAQQKQKNYLEHVARHDEKQAARQWSRTAERQAMVDEILARKPAPARNITGGGKSLTQLLSSKGSLPRDPQEILTLKPVITGNEPQTVTFELPVDFGALTQLGKLVLLVDPVEGREDAEAIRYRCHPAANGKCLISWQTDFESPGKHALQAELRLRETGEKGIQSVKGPLLPFVTSNVCQYSETSLHFDPELGAVLLAKILEPNASYRVDFLSPEGQKIRTLTGETTNSVIKVSWDLVDENGQRFTGDGFDTLFHVTLATSGKAYTQKGP